MRRYRYSYQTIVHYSAPITAHHFLLRCTPMEGGYQRIIERDLALLSTARYATAIDPFSAMIHYGSIMSSHDLFVVASSGVVECGEYRIEEATAHPHFLTPTSMTLCDEAMAQFDRGVSGAGSALQQACSLAEAIYSRMSYTPYITTTATTAAESFALGRGVCQDFSHILLALCRRRAIFARYVAGFVVGTGETHAWVEVYDDGAWRGVDPTHNMVVESGYIKLAHGRDAADCSVIRGVHLGAAEQSTQVRVVLEQLY